MWKSTLGRLNSDDSLCIYNKLKRGRGRSPEYMKRDGSRHKGENKGNWLRESQIGFNGDFLHYSKIKLQYII